MTDKETLFSYRLKQAEETLAEAEKMLQEGFSARSIINRTYYSMFYGVLALFIKENINPKTSKHSQVISLFDKEFILSGKLDKKFSRYLHKTFEARQQADYKEMAEPSAAEAERAVISAKDFLDSLKNYLV